jgi:para-nitrobenzyl esterase
MTETATTLAGKIRGEAVPTGVAFRGIPFAEAPTGSRRFLPPARCLPWDGVRDCTTFGPICPQVQHAQTGGVLRALGRLESTDEDCLFLNVWTPAVDDGGRPTMVWIHGGAFLNGSGSSELYDGAAFARDGVVMVSLNYRLHALGFLYLDEMFDGAQGTGNLGILDQIAALEWVRDNIAEFGGDPDNVTIFGESAGGMSVGTLLGTPAASGLFQRAIAQSGAAQHNVSSAAAQRVTRRVLELLEVTPGDWDALRAVGVNRLVELSVQVGEVEAAGLLGDERAGKMGFQPVIDGVTRSARPVDLVAAGSAAGVDLMIGTNAEEWRLFLWGLPAAMQVFLPDPDVAPYFATSGRSVDEVLKVYAASRPGQSMRDLLCAVETDQMFTIPAVRLAEAQLRHTRAIWTYLFSWRTPVLGRSLGACHGLDLPFVFEREQAKESEVFVGPAPPHDLAITMHRSWIRFATTGDPNGAGLPPWPAYETGTRPVMNFDTTRTLLIDPFGKERRLWDGLI